MSTYQVPLRFMPDCRWASLRDICGHDEQDAGGLGTLEAIRLLDRLVMDAPGSNVRPGKAKELPTAERDRLLAEIYSRTYGKTVESTVTCRKCQALFDVRFVLGALLDHLSRNVKHAHAQQGHDGVFTLPEGTCFRLPTGEDECAVLEMEPDRAFSVLLRRCVINRQIPDDPDAIERAMEEAAPLLDLDMDTRCPECGERQTVHFDIQHFLLTALGRGKKLLAREVDRLARTYGWSLSEILSLPRNVRLMYVDLVDTGSSVRQRGRS